MITITGFQIARTRRRGGRCCGRRRRRHHGITDVNDIRVRITNEYGIGIGDAVVASVPSRWWFGGRTVFRRPIAVGQFGTNVLIGKTHSLRTGTRRVFDRIAADQTATFKYRMRSYLFIGVVAIILVLVIVYHPTLGFIEVTIDA